MPAVATDVSSSAIENCLATLAEMPACIAPVNSDHKRWSYMKDSGFYIAPKPVTIGTRKKMRYNSKTSHHEEVDVDNMMQYTPTETLLGMMSMDSGCINLMKEYEQKLANTNGELISHYQGPKKIFLDEKRTRSRPLDEMNEI